MTIRGIVAILFSIVVLIEILFYIGLPTPTTSSGNTLFGSTVDYEAQSNQNMKFAVIIGATLLIGAIVSFAMPATNIANSTMKKLKKWLLAIITFLIVWIGLSVVLELGNAGEEISKYHGLIGFGAGVIAFIAVMLREEGKSTISIDEFDEKP